MKISAEFSKFAEDYESRNFIQNLVVKKLLSLVKTEPKKLLDLGCGSGAVCKNISWEYEDFTGVDFAVKMLELHPKSSKIELVYGDFNDKKLFSKLVQNRYDYTFSASALQWAENLEEIFANIKMLQSPIALAIFTSNTFKTLNETANINSMLKSVEEIQKLQKHYFNAQFEIVKYKLKFNTVREMFQYIKRSGVSGSRNLLSFREMKQLMREYPLNYLEFEVAFISS